jgi:methionine-rich copper-binding protein CopC
MKPIRLFAALTIAFLSLMINPLPASAHADFESSTPAAGETVEAGNIQVALMFGEEMLGTEASGTVISVQGPAGPDNAQWADGCIDSVRGKLVSESVSLSLPGTYVVDWRAVSADGHPVEGTFNFEVVNTTNYESQPPGQCEKSQISESNGVSQLLPVTDDSAKSQQLLAITPEEGLIGGIVVIAFISVIGAFMLRSQERKRESAEIAEKLARQKPKR